MTIFANHADFSKLEARNLVSHKLASAPASPVVAQRYYDTTLNKEGVWNGTSWDYGATGTVTTVSGTAPIVSSGGSAPAISILPASGSLAGSMSISDFLKLGAATAVNTASTIVQRDASGNFSAGTITAALTGTASNAAQLNSQAASFYLDRANHTGAQTASTISNFDAAVRLSRLDQMAAPTSAVPMNGQRLTGLAAPTVGSDAATKDYADGLAAAAARKYSQLIGDGTTTAITITHSLNNPTPVWACSQVATPFTSVTPTVTFPTANTTTFTFAVAPTTNQYRITIVG